MPDPGLRGLRRCRRGLRAGWCLEQLRSFGIDRAGEAAKIAEQLGYGALWVGGSPHVADVSPVLEATSTLVGATGILNVWINDPGETGGADAELRARFPGRLMLGIGIGHPEATSDYGRPLATMGEFLDGLDRSPTPPPVEGRCLAALGPKMLDLAGQRTAGAHTYFVPVEHFGSRVSDSVRASSWRPSWRAWWTPMRRAPKPLPATTRSCISACATTRRTYFGSASRGRRRARRVGSADRRRHPAGQRGADRRSVSARTSTPGADHVCLQSLGEAGIPRESWSALSSVLIS